ncbi:dipeptidyl aminopeptidase/acylaminoacyl peptidase [Aquimarina sp. EL_43]|uniref:S9 family peptidase n=1 Tax=unclassified Aquimarina TaxID=2627091 RepID=UPI0018CA30CA|nr:MULTISPECIES: S9 family peptidase [unclassified Aquimarina]MBG6129180.1 dipeptidyl aminopeptidase/acylaminoacyl peptidase [Aquimarina sp. EL_35]MBG6150245.1 dipeptidyl aminopeptidase/acylaminoacyl peptidase [Aquimarina sp. EL_32]MBG6167070.1 dipeptidyl aminopeptidase/acylaminoacyl peptidase [Aquimarina sp. EL_43]
MKKLLTFSMGLLLFYSCKQEKKEEIAQSIKIDQYSIEQFMDNENAFSNGFSADKSKVLMTSNRSGIYNMYTVATNGGELMPVTKSDSASVFGISYFPEDDRILFRMDGNGDEIYKIFVKDSSGIKRLTPEKNVRALFRGWAKDGKSFFYGSNERDPKYMDHYEMDIADFTSKLIYQNTDGMDFGGMSEDRKYIALSKSINTNDNDLYLLNTETKEKVKINDNLSGNSPEDFSPDGKSFYYTTDDNAEFSYLMKYNLEDGSKEKVLEKNWDISGFYFTRNGKYQVMFTNEDAKTVMEVKEVATGTIVDFPSIENQQINRARFSRDESMALLSVGGSNTPTNSYSYDLATKKYHKLTDVLNKDINPDHLVTSEVVRFKSFDGLDIPAIYYKPKQATVDHKVPALVWVHGGPGGQSRQGFSSIIQYLVNHGYAVLAVNNRGSSGYGKTFFKMDDRNHGDKDLKDCVAGKDWLAKQDIVDADKIGIIGGSYGGYMTMAALTYTPEEFKVGVNIFGVTNWLRTLKSIPPWWESFKEALYTEMGDPNTADSVRLRQISPLFHTEKVTKPLIVLQGAKDPRVLKVESDEIVEGVKKSGVPVEYVLFEDEGHGFVKKENQIEAYGRILKFLDKYLKSAGTEMINDGKTESTKIDSES